MKRIAISLLIFFTSSLPAFSQIVSSQVRTDGWARPAGELKVRLYGAELTGSSFYRLDGDLIDRFRDPADPEGTINPPIYREYSVTLNGYKAGIYSEYGLFNNLTLVMDLPVTRWNLKEKYSYDSTYFINPTPGDTTKVKITQHIQRGRADITRFNADYYGIGGRYAWVTGNSLIGVMGMVRVPPGFKNSTTTDSTGELLTDVAYEGVAGINLGLTIAKNWLSTSIRYNIRGGDFKDEIEFYTEFGTKTVETTQLLLFAKYIQSASTFQNTDNFNPRKVRFQENFFQVGAAFEIEFQKRFSLNAGYDIRLAGKNTWALSTFSVGTGIRFPEL